MKACTRTTSKKIFSFAALLILASYVGFAADAKLEDTLNHQYKDRVYTLRQPMTAPTQQYDSLGNSPTARALGPWTIYGRLLIKKIKLQPNRLVIEGRRVGMQFSGHAETLVPTRLDDKVTLEVSLSQPLNSADDVRAILSHIFAVSQEDFLASMPDLWRRYLADHLELYADDGKQIVFKKPVRAKGPPEPPPPGIYYVGKDVTAPTPTYTPDPSYTVTARGKKLSGTLVLGVVVDKSGMVRDVRLVRPLGLGLDEAAAEIVSTWKFVPAKRNGEPVAVKVIVEVKFDLW